MSKAFMEPQGRPTDDPQVTQCTCTQSGYLLAKLGFRVWGLGFRVGLGLRIQDLGFRD